MNEWSRTSYLLGLLTLVTMTACGGGGSPVVGVGGGSTTVAASFAPDSPNPGPNTVSLQQGTISSSLVTIEVTVTDTVALTGATFDLLYDPSRFSYVTSSAGDLFENAGANPISGVNQPAQGRLVVGIGVASAVPVNGNQVLIRLTFRADLAGSGLVSMVLSDLLDSSGQSVPGITWVGGTLVGT